jgi:hypothetical protein
MKKLVDEWYLKKISAEFELSFFENITFKLEHCGEYNTFNQWHLQIWDKEIKGV